ncbi:MAG: PAS domain S-box protein [Acidobacteria bacterium]|nr:MAG: PAS domain S-box protein [Acidobacteriota bacterium]
MAEASNGCLAPERILDHITDGILIVGHDETVLYANDAFARIVGREGQDLRGRKLSQLVPAETLAAISPKRLEVPRGQVHVHFNVQLGGPSARCSYCFTAYPFLDEANRCVGLIENFRNMDALRDTILELEEVNRVIRREKERTERILDAVGDGVFTVDRERVIRSFSRRLERITGVSAAEAVGRRCDDVLRGEKCSTDCPLLWTLEHGKPVDGCRERIVPGGNERVVEVTTAQLLDEDDEVAGVTAFVYDRTEVVALRRELARISAVPGIVALSPAMRKVLQQVRVAAETDVTVLITGASGTGKDVVARTIHQTGPRRDRPFVVVNCAALTETLLESELFGHVRGAFTGAVRDKPGRFELADGGTILLDEIADTSPALQAKLLRVLQDKQFERVGGTDSRRVDVRIIAATNRDLAAEVAAGRFREDLYYRLAVLEIHLPPLRERRADIPPLVEHFMEKFRAKYYAGREEEFRGISNRAMAMLLAYDWPGNVRELEHAIEVAMVTTTTGRIERAFLPPAIRRAVAPETVPPDEAVPTGPEQEEQRRILEVLRRNRWHVTRSARELGISRTTLWRRMKRYDLIR